MNWKIQRDKTLNNLGFDSYREYLDSKLWKKIRGEVLTTHEHKCYTCKCLANEVHHQSYSKEVLSGRDVSKLFPLCRLCHQTIEFCPDGFKMNHRKVVTQFYDLDGFSKTLKNFRVVWEESCSSSCKAKFPWKLITLNNKKVVFGAVQAYDADHVFNKISYSYYGSDFAIKEIQRMPDDWSPFSPKFKREKWMKWDRLIPVKLTQELVQAFTSDNRGKIWWT